MGVTKDDTEMTYTCRARNTAGEATSTANIVLQVTDNHAPKIISGAERMTVLEGDKLEIDISFTGKPKAIAKWLKNNKPLPKTPRYQSKITDNAAILIIPKATTEDRCDFTLDLTNSMGHATHTVTVDVIVPIEEVPTEVQGSPPEFTLTLQPAKVVEGDIAIFRCEVIGEPEPELTWYFKDVAIQVLSAHY